MVKRTYTVCNIHIRCLLPVNKRDCKHAVVSSAINLDLLSDLDTDQGRGSTNTNIPGPGTHTRRHASGFILFTTWPAAPAARATVEQDGKRTAAAVTAAVVAVPVCSSLCVPQTNMLRVGPRNILPRKSNAETCVCMVAALACAVTTSTATV